jgi:hypothetical protein
MHFMPRYYFDVRDNGELIRDDEGLELAHVREAEIEATAALVDIAKDSIRGTERRLLAIIVRSDKGRLFTASLDFQISRG